MKRRTIVAGYSLAALLLSALSLQQFVQYRQAASLRQTIAAVPESLSPEQYAALRNETSHSSAPELQLTYANALLEADHLDEGEAILSVLIQQDQRPQIAEAATFNLANAYLEQALATQPGSGRHRSLTELAKQRYRELLSHRPEHWDARYNLEVALRLIPETETYEVDERGKPIKSVSVVFPGFEDRELP